MSQSTLYQYQQLTPENSSLMAPLLDLFGEAFEEQETYCRKRPTDRYFRDLLSHDYFITLLALCGGAVVGGLVAYELKKFEQPRSEIYIYDLAVASEHRRGGIATTLIEELKRIARVRGAYVVFVQADIDDDPAIELYTRFGVREDVLHFDISVKSQDDAA
ncbi:MAG: AAC(3)-I family aminoglycoside N-acetyltransferase [Gammaproteobacteria bacterium]|nr:AAC(3)-I family aminoglycoside N-acetyltransferase [Gammaproteobacteria bacterium]